MTFYVYSPKEFIDFIKTNRYEIVEIEVNDVLSSEYSHSITGEKVKSYEAKVVFYSNDENKLDLAFKKGLVIEDGMIKVDVSPEKFGDEFPFPDF